MLQGAGRLVVAPDHLDGRLLKQVRIVTENPVDEATPGHAIAAKAPVAIKREWAAACGAKKRLEELA